MKIVDRNNNIINFFNNFYYHLSKPGKFTLFSKGINVIEKNILSSGLNPPEL